ncbi:MAG: hypothetical protein FJ313_04500, partial [Gemmatimonadetes bacterium]|nr:hypothetical protein [Gemmatimonadota bacterium]
MPPINRERVLKALNFEPADRVPIDIGGGPATRIHTSAYARLLQHLGFAPEQDLTAGAHPTLAGQNTICPSEKVLRHFDIDVRGFYLGSSNSRPIRPTGPHSYVDDWGVTWTRAHETAPHMNIAGPLERLDDPTPADLDAIAWPVPDDPGLTRGLRERIERARTETGCAICLNLPNAT